MDDLRTKYRRARQAKNQANLRAREERRNAEASLQAEGYWRRRAAEANAQTTAAEREARAAREALRARERSIERQSLLLAELQREVTITRGQLEDALAREARRDTKQHDVPPMLALQPGGGVTIAREATERAMARIEPHARPWWQRLVWWPKNDGGR